MDGATTAPDVIQSEASASVEKPLARVPLVLNRRNFSWITERISGAVENVAPRWGWVTFAITSMVAMFGVFCLGYQISTGGGVWGLNHPVGWRGGTNQPLFLSPLLQSRPPSFAPPLVLLPTS